MTAPARVALLARQVEQLRARADEAHPSYRPTLHREAARLAQQAERIARLDAQLQQLEHAA